MKTKTHCSSATLADIIQKRQITRRGFMQRVGLGAAAGVMTRASAGLASGSALSDVPLPFGFQEIPKQTSAAHPTVAEGYDIQVLLSWGDALGEGGAAFNPPTMDADEQMQRFGYNNDYLAFFPMQKGSGNSDHGLLCVNHEYTNRYLMFSGLTKASQFHVRDDDQSRIEMQAHGCSIVEIKRDNGAWQYVPGSQYNRRVTATTPMRFSGAAAGADALKTSQDPDGMRPVGTIGNCAGGTTPWGTLLTAEENFDHHFAGQVPPSHEQNHQRYTVGQDSYYQWHHVDARFDLTKEPNEPHRFGWVVEIDPYNPEATPVKRTALGRFKHECATTALAPSGQAVVFSGDDEMFEYVYRFVSRDVYKPGNHAHNMTLLDRGVLSVARFDAHGTMEWLPLVHGQRGLTKENGFVGQSDVLIYARKAADIVGATPMDRAEDVQVNPETGEVFVVLTKNTLRTSANPANTRPFNKNGHIVTLSPPSNGSAVDYAADSYSWDMFLEAGNPADASDHAYYKHAPSEHGWLTNPDNVAFDERGNVWICTDGQSKTIGACEGVYATPTRGASAGKPHLFFTAPVGAEVTGPEFTPDNTTLFLSVQHPGEGSASSFDAPSTRWPDNDPSMPPRPSVIAITRKAGGKIGEV